MYRNFSELGTLETQNKDQYNVTEIQNHEQKVQLVRSNRLVVVEIFGDWCAPCKTLSPQYSILANTYNKAGLCQLVKQDYSKLTDAEKANITAIPLTLFYMQGKLLGNYSVAGADVEKIEQNIQTLLDQAAMPNEDISLMKGQTLGPQYNSASIRNNRPQQQAMPNMNNTSDNSVPYNNTNYYHQPYAAK